MPELDWRVMFWGGKVLGVSGCGCVTSASEVVRDLVRRMLRSLGEGFGYYLKAGITDSFRES